MAFFLTCACAVFNMSTTFPSAFVVNCQLILPSPSSHAMYPAVTQPLTSRYADLMLWTVWGGNRATSPPAARATRVGFFRRLNPFLIPHMYNNTVGIHYVIWLMLFHRGLIFKCEKWGDVGAAQIVNYSCPTQNCLGTYMQNQTVNTYHNIECWIITVD